MSYELVAALRPLVALIRKSDATLARQIIDATSSISLNLAEGARRVGKDRPHFHRIADGSCGKVRAALRVAIGWGYLDGADTTPAELLLDRQAALVYRLLHRRAA